MVKPRAQEKVTAAVGRGRPDRPTCQDALPALIEVVAQNHINEVGLRNLTFTGLSLNEFLVVVLNDQWFIVGRKRPRTDMADQRASSACVALGSRFWLTSKLCNW